MIVLPVDRIAHSGSLTKKGDCHKTSTWPLRAADSRSETPQTVAQPTELVISEDRENPIIQPSQPRAGCTRKGNVD
jgi:hypothetical protein